MSYYLNSSASITADPFGLLDHYFDSIDFSKAKYPCERFVERIDIDPPCGLEQITKLVPMESVSAEWCAIESIEDISPDATQGYSTFRGGDVIWARITPCMENGKSAVVESEPSECFCGSTEFLVFRPKDDKVSLSQIACKGKAFFQNGNCKCQNIISGCLASIQKYSLLLQPICGVPLRTQ